MSIMSDSEDDAGPAPSRRLRANRTQSKRFVERDTAAEKEFFGDDLGDDDDDADFGRRGAAALKTSPCCG